MSKKGDLITKTFGGDGIPELSRQGAFDLELRVLKLLEENRDMCDNGRRHFPKPTSWIRDKKQLTMTYEGLRIEFKKYQAARKTISLTKSSDHLIENVF